MHSFSFTTDLTHLPQTPSPHSQAGHVYAENEQKTGAITLHQGLRASFVRNQRAFRDPIGYESYQGQPHAFANLRNRVEHPTGQALGLGRKDGTDQDI